VLGGFINPPLPSVLTPTSMQQGSLAPRALPRFVATTSLAAAVSSSADFPGVRLYDLPGSAALAAGRGRFLQLLGMPLSPCCPYPPRRSDRPPRSARGPSCCLRPEAEGSASGVIFFSRPPLGSLTLRPGDSLAIPKMASSVGFIRFVSSTDATQATKVLTLPPVGLTPTEHASLSWTHYSAIITSGCFSDRGAASGQTPITSGSPP